MQPELVCGCQPPRRHPGHALERRRQRPGRALPGSAYNIGTAATYVTGAHNVKVGFQYNWGPYINTRETNADLQQVYQNGVPIQVTVYQHAAALQGRAWSATSAVYAQDTWTLNRLTVNCRPPLGVPERRGLGLDVR